MLNLGINNSGNFNPYIKVNAKDGTLSKRVDGEDQFIEPTEFSGLMDFNRIKTGQFDFQTSPPVKIYDEALDKPQADIGGGFKRGFCVLVHSPDAMGGTFEFSSTSAYVKRAIGALYAEWENKKTSELPVVKMRSIKEEKSSHGKVYVPDFYIDGYFASPPELLEIEIDLPAQEPQATPIPNGSGAVSQQSSGVNTPLPHTVAPQPSEQNSTKKNF